LVDIQKIVHSILTNATRTGWRKKFDTIFIYYDGFTAATDRQTDRQTELQQHIWHLPEALCDETEIFS